MADPFISELLQKYFRDRGLIPGGGGEALQADLASGRLQPPAAPAGEPDLLREVLRRELERGGIPGQPAILQRFDELRGAPGPAPPAPKVPQWSFAKSLEDWMGSIPPPAAPMISPAPLPVDMVSSSAPAPGAAAAPSPAAAEQPGLRGQELLQRLRELRRQEQIENALGGAAAGIQHGADIMLQSIAPPPGGSRMYAPPPPRARPGAATLGAEALLEEVGLEQSLAGMDPQSPYSRGLQDLVRQLTGTEPGGLSGTQLQAAFPLLAQAARANFAGAPAPRVIPGQQVTDLAGIKTVLGMVDEAEQLYDQQIDELGPVKSRAKEAILKVLGEGSPAFVKLSNLIDQIVSRYVLALSGRAATDKERAMIRGQIMQKIQSPEAFRAAVDQFRQSLTRDYNARVEALGQAGYSAEAFPPLANRVRFVGPEGEWLVPEDRAEDFAKDHPEYQRAE